MSMNIPFYSDQAVASVLDYLGVEDALCEVFADVARGQAAIFPRHRIDCATMKLSGMGAIWQKEQVAAFKSYTTVNGQFSFLVSLFDLANNSVAAVLAGAELTRFRTAAMVLLVARRAMQRKVDKVAIFGFGVQGRAISQAICMAFKPAQLCVVDPLVDSDAVSKFGLRHSIQAVVCDPENAVRDANLVITATRSKQPVFHGEWISPGAVVIAVGTSLPTGTELDDTTLRRAGRLIVEWKPQSLLEAGEVVIGKAHGALEDDRIVDLCEIFSGRGVWRASPEEVVVFKSVGVGLADLAAAWLVHLRLYDSKKSRELSV